MVTSTHQGQVNLALSLLIYKKISHLKSKGRRISKRAIAQFLIAKSLKKEISSVLIAAINQAEIVTGARHGKKFNLWVELMLREQFHKAVGRPRRQSGIIRGAKAILLNEKLQQSLVSCLTVAPRATSRLMQTLETLFPDLKFSNVQSILHLIK